MDCASDLPFMLLQIQADVQGSLNNPVVILQGNQRLRLCLHSVKPANGRLRHFSILEVYQLDLIVGNDRSHVITLIKFGEIERFIIQTNSSGKALNNLCPILQLVSQISRKRRFFCSTIVTSRLSFSVSLTDPFISPYQLSKPVHFPSRSGTLTAQIPVAKRTKTNNVKHKIFHA